MRTNILFCGESILRKKRAYSLGLEQFPKKYFNALKDYRIMYKVQKRIDQIGDKIYQIALLRPWGKYYGLARSILALGTLSTLLFNNNDVLFRLAAGINKVPICNDVTRGSIFCIFNENLGLARWICILILLVVIFGWRPMITGILHWWVSYSFMISSVVIDGGDQITAVLTLLLIPVCLTDKRKWRWSDKTNAISMTVSTGICTLIALSSLFMIRLQVAIIYLNSGVAKFYVSEWTNGTALYYWFTHPIFGFSEALEPILTPIITNPYSVTLLTWGVMFFEILLFLGITIKNRYRNTLLISGLVFHFLIFIIHGLFSFFLAMCGALILFLKTDNERNSHG